MDRRRSLASWLAVFIGGAGFAVGLSAQESVRALSQAVVTPDRPLWANAAQDPDTPAPTPAPAEAPAPAAPQAPAGRGGRGNPNQPRPFNQVITTDARTDEGIFKVHRVKDQL